MKTAEQIVFRRITRTDFYNIYKLRGSEAHGGGQGYIDFPTSTVSLADWKHFFAGVEMSTEKSGPLWRFTVASIGVGKSQIAEISQRRSATFSIRRQKLGTKAANRLYAWHPDYTGFPTPADPTKREGISNLVVYLVRTTSGEFWADWFQRAAPDLNWQVDERLRPMFSQRGGCIYHPDVNFDETDGRWPFETEVPAAASNSQKPAQSGALPPGAATPKAKSSRSAPSRKQSPHYRERTEEQVVEELFFDDVSPETTQGKRQILRSVLKRNEKAVASLKALYQGECQLTGRKYAFKKVDGRTYCEAHHLIPLGEGGADSPHNLIIVSPLIHRMFHYAEVSSFDLGKIVDNKLEIKINGDPYTITWHPRHADLVAAAAKSGQKT